MWSFRRSHPSRVRGLKFRGIVRRITRIIVAPFTGAWIEIEVPITDVKVGDKVAPFTGAWIEIGNVYPVTPVLV